MFIPHSRVTGIPTKVWIQLVCVFTKEPFPISTNRTLSIPNLLYSTVFCYKFAEKKNLLQFSTVFHNCTFFPTIRFPFTLLKDTLNSDLISSITNLTSDVYGIGPITYDIQFLGAISYLSTQM